VQVYCSEPLGHRHVNMYISGPVTADMTTTVVHNYKLLINDFKPVHSLTP